MSFSFFGLGRRRGPNGVEPTPTSEPNLTNYDEKTVFRTESEELKAGAAAMPAAGTTTATATDSESSVYGQADERPMVFATRQNPDMYIYEYSDRLETYIKTSSAMLLYKTEYKRR